MKKRFTFLMLILLIGSSISFGQQRGPNPKQEAQKAKLLQMAKDFKQKQEQQKAEAVRIANEKGWVVRQETPEGATMEIQYIDAYGMPQYYTTTNLNAARTVNTDDLWVGGSSGLNLDGSGFILGEWDGGGILTTHQEFDNGSGTRVTQMDSPSSTSWHSTHVAGTMIAEGQVSAAHGMAPEALLHAYDWNSDDAEMATAAAGGLTISNHSYGWNRGWVYDSSSGNWYWYGNPGISSTEDYLFGFYDASAHDWDQIAVDAPDYLIVKSAGNDRNDDHSGGHYVYSGGSWVYSTASRDPDGGTDGYDCIGQHGVAKNVLTVGAVNDITAGWTQPSDVVMTTFSSWGPTDDGRIKPDIVANGKQLYSCSDAGNSSYTYSDGTSMSSPNTTGTLALLQDYYQQLHSGPMSAAALKGLVINTANEAGPADGPDYMFGWGLLNATGAADLITQDDAEGGLIVEAILQNSQTTEYTYYTDGTSDINITLCWTDPAGTPPAASLNPSTLMLVNDLNVKLINNSTSSIHYPWMLNPSNPSGNAYKGENYRDNVETINYKSPAAGYYTIRINQNGSLSGGQQAYALIINGMTTAPTGTYCSARASSQYEYIQNITFGSINNTTDLSPGGYADYSGLSTTIAKGASETLSLTLGNPYSNDDGYAWADWNHDGDFNDAGESFVLGSGTGPYSASITVPSTAVSGYTTLRVRLVDSYAQNPCGTSFWGETEDYAIFVQGTPGLWTGLVSTDWNDPNNWDDLNVPTSSTDVNIYSGTPYQPTISSGYAYANDLHIYSGASLTQMGTSYFYVYGDFNSDLGTFTQTGLAYLYFSGTSNSYWDDDNVDDTYLYVRVQKSNASYSVNMWQDMTVGQSFEIREGEFKIDQTWTLTVNGTSSYAFQVENGGILTLVDESIDVAGGIEFEDGSQANVSGGTIYCGGNFTSDANTSYDIQFTGGTVYMDGSSDQSIINTDENLQYNNFTVAKSSGNCTVAAGDLNIAGDMTINGGTLVASGKKINIAGNWTNNVGTSAFNETGSRVVFNSPVSGHQYCTSEHFDTLEIAKAAGGAFRPFSGVAYTIECNVYDWTAGGIDIVPGGSTFTANDLLDNGIFGFYYLNPGGTINLTNDASGYVDLDGDLHIYGGTMNVYGGNGTSWWPYLADASITMSDGVLDFHDQGIYLYNSPTYNLTENITGGVIRTSGGFSGDRGDFTPTAGTFEFYGTGDYALSESNGCTLFDVNIDKGSKVANAGTQQGAPIMDERSKTIVSDGGKSNTNSLYSDFVITNNLTITSGGLTLSGYTLTVAHDADIYGTLTMDNAADALYVGTDSFDLLMFYSGSTGNFSAGNVYLAWGSVIYNGASFTATTANTIHYNSAIFRGGIANDDPNTKFGNFDINKSSGYFQIWTDGSQPIVVDGNFDLAASNQMEMQDLSMIVHGNFTDQSTSELYLYNALAKSANTGNGGSGGTKMSTGNSGKAPGAKGGQLEIDTDVNLNGLLDLSDGDALLHGDFNMASTATLNITTGSLIADQVYQTSKAWQTLNGTINLTSGLFEISHNSMQFSSTSVNNISGGTTRCGFSFQANDAGVFQPSGGVVEFTGDGAVPRIECSNGNYFYKLLIDRSTEILIWTDITVKNDIQINGGPLNTNNTANQYNMFVGGNWTNNGGDAAFIEDTGTVTFDGSNAADITTDETFYNLSLNKTYAGYDGLELNTGGTFNVTNDLNIIDGTLEMNANSTLNIGNNVDIALNAGLNAYGDGGLSIFVGGNWTNNNTTSNTIAGYSTGTETITFNGTGDQLISSNAPREEFGYLVIDKASGQFRPNSNLDVKHNLHIIDGEWNDNVNSLTHYFEGDFTVDATGAYFTHLHPNTATFKSTSDQTINYNGSSGYFYDMVIDKTAWTAKQQVEGAEPVPVDGGNQTKAPESTTVSLATMVRMQNGNGLTIDEGTFNLNGNTFWEDGTLNINDGGVLVVDDNADLHIPDGNTISVNTGGVLNVIGSAGNEATISHRSTGDHYSFIVASGGTLAAEYAVLEYMDWYGVWVQPGGLMDPAHAFNYTTFQHVDAVSSASDLTLENGQVLTSTGANFPDNPYYNAYKDNSSGLFTFDAATGDFAGAEYEYDPSGLVDWGNVDVNLDLTVMLEGAFNGVDMNTDLYNLGLIPTSQPFNSNTSADWYYTGTESVGVVPVNVVDWVLVQIRDANDPASVGTVVAQQAAFLLNDGSIVDLDGTSNLSFAGISYSDGLYPVIWQRNHLGIIAANKMTRNSGIYTYDFTASGSAYGNTNAGEKSLGSGVFGMFAGDANGGGVISLLDHMIWGTQAGTTGYQSSDFNLNGQVDNVDKNDFYNDNIGLFSQIAGSKSNNN